MLVYEWKQKSPIWYLLNNDHFKLNEEIKLKENEERKKYPYSMSKSPSNLDCEGTTISRDVFPFLKNYWEEYLLSQEEWNQRAYFKIKENNDGEKYIDINLNEIERFIPWEVFKSKSIKLYRNMGWQ